MALTLILSLLAFASASVDDITPSPLRDPSDESDYLSGYRHVILPVSVGEHWRPAKLSELRCPKQGRGVNDEYKIVKVFNLTRYDHFNPASVHGYLCHKMKWVTACEYTWYFSKTISRRIIPLTPTVQDCTNENKLKRGGMEESGSYPPEECYWNSYNEEEVTEVHLTYHVVNMDPYTMEFVDSQFLNGRCSLQFCDTIHSSVKWIADRGNVQVRCGEKVTEQGEFLARSNSSEEYRYSDLVLYSHHVPHTSLKGACLMTFCGDMGIQLHNGFWFHLPDLSSFPQDSLKACPKGTTAGAIKHDYSIDVLKFSIEALREDMACLDALESIQLSGALSYRKLHYLHPRDAGIHPIYRIVNGSLEINTAKYIAAFPVSAPSEDCIGEFYKQGKLECISWYNWLDVTPTLKQGFNGLMKDHDRIMIPNAYLTVLDWDPEIHSIRYLTTAQHPFYTQIDHLIEDLVKEEIRHDKSKNIGDSVSNVVGSIGQRISAFFYSFKEFFTGLGILIVCVLFGLILLKIIRIRKKKNNPTPRVGADEISLRTMDTQFG
ncbi:glycoprotein [Rhinolophus rhabdovirus DPuer]|nr:glycoprotein [Rhinolophus rhabdovirus DPuer]